MAEVVQRSLEELMSVFEALERVQLFTPKEIKYVIKRCKEFEYKIIRNDHRDKRDFVEYIKYLTNFLALIWKRRKLMKYFHKKEEIDKAASVKIEKLFALACGRYRSDVNLWLSKIEFLKKRKFHISLGRTYSAMLQTFPKKDHLWILAAKYEFEDQQRPNEARSLLQRALRIMPESKKLWLEMFRMELMFVEKILKRRRELFEEIDEEKETTVEDSILKMKLVMLVFQQAMANVPNDAEFCLEFALIAKQFSFADVVIEDIYCHLNTKFEDNEERRRVLIEKTFDDGLARLRREIEDDEGEEFVGKLLELEESCCQLYLEAVETLNTPKMWRLYLNFFLTRLDETKDDLQRMKKMDEMNDLFIKCSAVDAVLDERLISRWVDLSTTTKDKQLALSVGVKVCASSMDLWTTYLKLMMSTNESPKVIRRLFNNALKHIPKSSSISLWQLAMQWTLIKCPKKAEKFFEASLLFDECIASAMKSFYLEWIFVAKGLDETRVAFKRLATLKPNNMSLYDVYIELETASSANGSASALRECFELAILDCGRENIELWTKYIYFECSHCGGRPENASNIYNKATKCLKNELVEEFVRKSILSGKSNF